MKKTLIFATLLLVVGISNAQNREVTVIEDLGAGGDKVSVSKITHTPAELATGINVVAGNDVQSVAYNLQGQRVNNAAKGIIIVNGKKYLNK